MKLRFWTCIILLNMIAFLLLISILYNGCAWLDDWVVPAYIWNRISCFCKCCQVSLIIYELMIVRVVGQRNWDDKLVVNGGVGHSPNGQFESF